MGAPPSLGGDRHVVLVGAGVVGLCIADELLDHGFRVTVLDRTSDPRDGCSYGNGGMIVPSHLVPLAAPGMVAMGLRMMLQPGSPFGVRAPWRLDVAAWLWRFMRSATAAHVRRSAPVLRDLNLLSRDLYQEKAAVLGPQVAFEHHGLLLLCKSARTLDAERHLADTASALGLAATAHTAAGLAALETGAHLDVAGGVLFADDAHLSPGAFMSALEARFRGRGGVIRYDVEATGFARVGSRVGAVLTNDGDVPGDEFVLAAGAWSGALARSVGLRLPMLAGKGYGFTVTDPPETPRFPSILTESRVAVTPMPEGVRFVGTMELGRPEPRVNARRVAGMRDAIPAFYPRFRGHDLRGSAVWVGQRPCSPDGMPYIGRLAGLPNVTVATGHAMMGMSLGPVTGRLVRQILTGERPSVSLDLLRPERFG